MKSNKERKLERKRKKELKRLYQKQYNMTKFRTHPYSLFSDDAVVFEKVYMFSSLPTSQQLLFLQRTFDLVMMWNPNITDETALIISKYLLCKYSEFVSAYHQVFTFHHWWFVSLDSSETIKNLIWKLNLFRYRKQLTIPFVN